MVVAKPVDKTILLDTDSTIFRKMTEMLRCIRVPEL
jgi:hypothetical protein